MRKFYISFPYTCSLIQRKSFLILEPFRLVAAYCFFIMVLSSSSSLPFMCCFMNNHASMPSQKKSINVSSMWLAHLFPQFQKWKIRFYNECRYRRYRFQDWLSGPAKLSAFSNSLTNLVTVSTIFFFEALLTTQILWIFSSHPSQAISDIYFQPLTALKPLWILFCLSMRYSVSHPPIHQRFTPK